MSPTAWFLLLLAALGGMAAIGISKKKGNLKCER
jgi:hypothetical protein